MVHFALKAERHYVGRVPSSSRTPADQSQDDVRSGIRTWLSEQWDPDLSLLTWRTKLVDSGWAAPSWDQRWHGRGLPAWSDQIVADAIAAHGAVGTPVGGGMGLAAPTILEHGPDTVRERFLRPILTGEETWCQLFSEPGAGSDLAGVTSHAVDDGDQWIVNGQKVWNTSAHHADFGMLVARTNWDVPKHRGLTYFVLPMKQPGVEARPLRQMNHHASFNEVFLSDAIIPKEFVVGEVGLGWSVALTTLAFERHFGSMRRPFHKTLAGLAVEEAELESDRHFETYKWYPQRAGRVDLIAEHAKDMARESDPVVRQEVAGLVSLHRSNGWTADRAKAARSLGRPPGAEGSLGKLALSNVARKAAMVHSMIGGAAGMLSGVHGTYEGTIAEILVSVPGQSIAGGTDEIQKNIIGEKVLGLPREPSLDREIPFREVTRNL